MKVDKRIEAAAALLESCGERVSVRRVHAILKLALGRAVRWSEIADALKLLPGNSAGNTPATPRQQSGNDFEHGGQHPGNTPATVGQRLKRERAHAERDNTTLPSLSLGYVSPKETSSGKPSDAKKAVLTAPEIDFGEDELLVGEVIEAERNQRKSGKLLPTTIAALRSELWRLRDKHGVELWRHGCAVAAERATGVRYAAGVMRGEGARQGNSSVTLPLARSPTSRNGKTGKFVHYDGERSEAEVLAFLREDT